MHLGVTVATDQPKIEDHSISPLASAYADKVTALLQAIAGAQPNRELFAQIENVNSRLFFCTAS